MADDRKIMKKDGERQKLAGFEFYEKVLASPKFVVAPMVDASELAWRILSRNHGAQLCYTPMFHSNCFAKDPKYRKDSMQTCPEDRPLIVQFCGNDPKTMLEAALLAQDHCDAIDINLGCPQAIAKRGHYGAFLQEEWELLAEIVSTLHHNLNVPVTCKIRIFQDMDKTISYAKMLEAAGCQMLTVHGRTREMKGPLTGLADWNYIKTVKENVKIPVFANGNILSVQDVERCLHETNANGVMTAEGNLYNPAIFEGCNPPAWDMAYEYLDIVEKYPAPTSYIRGHLFKLFHHLLNIKSNAETREKMALCHTVTEFKNVVQILEEKYSPYHEGIKTWDENVEITDCNLKLPPWLCQPYFRPPPEEHIQKMEEFQRKADDPNREKRVFYDDEGNEISRKKMKKMQRISRRPNRIGRSKEEIEQRARRFDDHCVGDFCTNPVGQKCEHRLCKTCCKEKCFLANLNCVGHKIQTQMRREKAKSFGNPPSDRDFVGKADLTDENVITEGS